MIDHAQAKINLINAAVVAAHNIEVKLAFPLDEVEIACLKQLKRAVAEYKETNQAKRVDESGNEFDSFHGCG